MYVWYKAVIKIHLHIFFVVANQFLLIVLVPSFPISLIYPVPYMSGLLWAI